jgi:probable F420-dependent oxidoreductase
MGEAVKFGVALPNGFPGGQPTTVFLEVAKAAEEWGYDSLWAGDHVVFHIPRFEVFTTLAAAVARTSRVTVGPAVLLLALRNPVHVAQTVATLDHLSGGRFVLGVGVGGEHPSEFMASGVALRERGSRTNEALEVLKLLWTKPSVAFRGKHYRFDEISMKPQPLQKPHPPIWIGGRSDAALRRTVAAGNGWAPGFVTPQRYEAGWRKIVELCRRSGRDPGEITRAVYIFACMDTGASPARDEAAAYLSKNYNMPFGPLERYTVMGGPRDCVAAVRRYLSAGVEHLIVRFASFDPLGQLKLWTNDVLPALR